MQPYSSAYAVVRDPTDVVGRRIAALVIDWGIALALLVVLGLSVAHHVDYSSATRAEDACNDINDDATDRICVPLDTTALVYSGGDLVLVLLVPFALHLANDGVLTGITGFSVGKGLVGLRVIRQSDGRLCGFGRALLRWLLWIADGAPYCLPIVGLVTGLTTKGHRRVGDMAAGTLVVDKRDVGVVPVVPGLNAMAPPPWGPAVVGTPPPTWGRPTAPPGPVGWGPPGAPASPPTGPPAPPAWGQPAPQPAPPAAPAWGQPAAAPPRAAVNPGVDAPLWDDARDTYIQWDPEIAAWVQWDEAARTWRPIL